MHVYNWHSLNCFARKKIMQTFCCKFKNLYLKDWFIFPDLINRKLWQYLTTGTQKIIKEKLIKSSFSKVFSFRWRSAGTATLWQCCHNGVTDVVTTLWYGRKWEMLRRRSSTLSRRCQGVATMLLQRRHNIKHCVSDFFPPSKRERVTKVLEYWI